MAYFLSLQHDPHIDRILHILVHYSREKHSWQELRDTLLRDGSHPFRLACLKYIHESLARDRKQQRADAEMQHLNDTIERSMSLKIGRICTWPARKIQHMVKALFQ